MAKQIKVTSLPEEVKAALLALLKDVEAEDEYIRLQQLRVFKKNNLFWHGFQYLFWSEIDSDWRIPTQEQFDELQSRAGTDQEFRYIINIYKAHGESIIAALSADIPDVRFGPRDADDPDDRRAVNAADNTVELITRWNRAKLLIINALFYLATEGFAASYTYNKKDEAFGTHKINIFGKRMEQTGPNMATCSSCDYNAPAENVDEGPNQGQIVHSMNDPCPQCQAPLEIEPGMQEEVPFIQGDRLVPKGREIIEIYGALNVRVPSYVTKQADAGYLIHYVDAHPSMFKEAFSDVADKISPDPGQDYDRMMRQSSLSMDGYQLNLKLTTQKRCWFRPWSLWNLGDQHVEGVKWIRKNFPHGIYSSFIGETICEVRDESMDKHWSLTKAGPSKGIHADPLLQSLVPIQEMTNNLENLFMMQVEYSVPATYADTEVYDFEGQSKQSSEPGFVYPVTPRPGQSIGDAFYTEKTATLSQEGDVLRSRLDQDAQFTIGSFPSIYGGPSVSGSKTLGEYDRSRSFALQRLSLVWYFINVWWGETVHKSLLSFIEHQIDDEPLTTQIGPGNFQTKWVKAADLKGSFQRLEPDVSADFPSTFAQKKATLMNIFQLGNDAINSALLTPDNADTLQRFIGIRELKFPDAIQRNKQMREILILTGMDPQEGVEGPQSSVPIEPEVDDHPVHIEVLTGFIAGDTGQDLKESNPGAYANCLAHLIEHKQYLAMTQMPPQLPMGVKPPNPPVDKPTGTNPGVSVQ